MSPGTNPTGSTRVAAVIGDPIHHSLSPAIHNAAFRATGLDWVYVAFRVGSGDVPRALDGVRALGIEGLSVTMPHKQAAARAVDEIDDDARQLDAVNCVHRTGDRLVGSNTDGRGLVASLADAGFDPAGRRCVVLGAGGAARAIIMALSRAGAAEVGVVNRTVARAETAAVLAGVAGRVVPEQAVADAQLVVNATSIGMGEVDPASTVMPLADELIRPGLVVADIVMHPIVTPMLRVAAERGAVVVDGVGMLVHQAALAFEQWTGIKAPLSVMQTAARTRLEAAAHAPRLS